MFIKTSRVIQEAYFATDRRGWANGSLVTRDIYCPVTVSEILVNVDHLVAAYPKTYKSGMQTNTPPNNAQDKWLCEMTGTKIILRTGASFVVTASLSELDAVIGTQYLVDVA